VRGIKVNRSDGPVIAAFDGNTPLISSQAWIAPTAVITGQVVIEDDANVWFGVVARGDVERIRVGRGANIQDGCILHTDPGQPLEIDSDVSIGHGALVHGCTIEKGALIGMGAIILTGAKVGAGAVIGAGTVVLEGQEIPPLAIAVGVPARIVGKAHQAGGLEAAKRYRERATKYRATLALEEVKRT
jgi:carbonic anhydrase/acetyltransferase-like protein (isoleucine patch superfamily)